MGKTHLFGYGNLKSYGHYCIVAADDINEATTLIQSEIFKEFKNHLLFNKENALFDGDTALNGCADIFLYCERKGYYDMDDDELFDAFCKNEFGKDLFLLELDEKTFEITDLKTNVWNGEFA